MILLDTNVVSELDNKRLSANVGNWFSVQDPTSLFICDPVVMELAFGAERAIKKDNNFRYKNSLVDLISNVFANRIIPFTTECAVTAGRLRAAREAIGRPVAAPDMMIAAIALHNNMTLATRNMRDFDGLEVKLINPFEAS
jgi:toxin FitB